MCKKKKKVVEQTTEWNASEAKKDQQHLDSFEYMDDGFS